VRLEAFASASPGALVAVHGVHPRFGEWSHKAFVPDPLGDHTPALSPRTFNAVASARAALAGLDASARRLPNPALLRGPTLRREAQSTSALEGTYAAMRDVLAAEEDEEQQDASLNEVMNYVRVAEHAFTWLADGRTISVGLLEELQGRLVRGTPADGPQAGRVRDVQVVIGANPGAHVQDARFVPRPPGPELDAQVRDLLGWMGSDHDGQLDPVVAAGMAHYQFETLHPFNDGNGRLGRLLVVLHLMQSKVLSEPTLTVSPWFEARRADYYEGLLGVSTRGDWDSWIRLFADGLAQSAHDTETSLHDLLAVQEQLRSRVRNARLRAENAMIVVDFALAQPIFTVRAVERRLGVTYARANQLVGQLVDAGVLRQYDEAVYDRRFTAPDVLAVLLR
jgi:Fic family protein